DLGIVSRMADKVAVMYAGQIVESGTAVSIFESPLHPYTQGLMACLPTPERKRMQHLRAIPGAVPSLVGRLSGCRFRGRCAYAQPICEQDVALRSHVEAHAYRCVLPPDISLANAALA